MKLPCEIHLCFLPVSDAVLDLRAKGRKQLAVQV